MSDDQVCIAKKKLIDTLHELDKKREKEILLRWKCQDTPGYGGMVQPGNRDGYVLHDKKVEKLTGRIDYIIELLQLEKMPIWPEDIRCKHCGKHIKAIEEHISNNKVTTRWMHPHNQSKLCDTHVASPKVE